MAFPEYVPTRVVTVGGAMSVENADSLLRVAVEIRSSHSLIWDATGYRFEKTGKAAVGELGTEVSVILPRTDVAGWKDAATGSVIDVSVPDSYSHRYTAVIRFIDQNGRTIGTTYTVGPFVLPAGTGAVDLDKMVPASSVPGGQVSIPDVWGQMVAAAEAAAAAAEAALIDSDSFIASQITTPATQTKQALSATYGAALLPTGAGAVGDASADDTTALAALISAAPVKSIIDLGGKTYRTTASITIGKELVVRNGAIVGGAHTVFTITAADVTFRDLSITRSTSGTGTLAQLSAVVVNAQRFRSIDCNYTDAALACLYFNHGTCNHSIVRGGNITNSRARQDACGIYVAAGTVGNTGIRIENVNYVGAGAAHGFILFDASGCRVTGCRVVGARKLPTITLSGWTLVSGNIYRTAERTDGGTRVLKRDGVKVAEASGSSTPGTNQWGSTGGFIYANFGGTDPNTLNLTSDIVSGYGITFYASDHTGDAGAYGMVDNRVTDCVVLDCDGFGIYMQLDKAHARNNRIVNCLLRNVCLTGIQDTSLPFAGIGWGAGTNNLISDVQIEGVGTAETPAPGISTNPPTGAANGGSGRMVNVTVRGASNHGYDINSSGWVLSACVADSNWGHGFDVTTKTSADDWTVEFANCEAVSNSLSGFSADQSPVSGSRVRPKIVGGRAQANAQRGVIYYAVRYGIITGGFLGFANGSTSFPQIFLRGACLAPVVDNVTVDANVAGQGLVVEAACTDVSLGIVNYGATLGTPATISVTNYRAGGSRGSSSFVGTGSPEGVLAAPVGAQYRRTDGGAGTTFYVKESGTGNTGWVAK